jgi:hypothetical protein
MNILELKKEQHELRKIKSEIDQSIEEGYRARAKLELQAQQLKKMYEDQYGEPLQVDDYVPTRFERIKQWFTGRR